VNTGTGYGKLDVLPCPAAPTLSEAERDYFLSVEEIAGAGRWLTLTYRKGKNQRDVLPVKHGIILRGVLSVL
jgi:hypothetical protein